MMCGPLLFARCAVPWVALFLLVMLSMRIEPRSARVEIALPYSQRPAQVLVAKRHITALQPLTRLRPRASCTPTGHIASCLFTESICWQPESGTFIAAAIPFSSWRNTSTFSRPNVEPKLGGAGLFAPAYDPTFSTTCKHCLLYPGTVYLLNLWFTHYGHVIVDMQFPLYAALVDWNKTSPAVSIVYYRDTAWNAEQERKRAVEQIQFLSWQEVTALEDLRSRALRQNAKALCFEELIVGFRYVGAQSPNIEAGRIDQFSAYVAALQEISTIPQRSSEPCKILMLERDPQTAKRNVLNVAEIYAVLRTTRCVVQILWPEDHSPLTQYQFIRQADIVLAISGTLTHNVVYIRRQENGSYCEP